MYVAGPTSLFNYDHEPNQFSILRGVFSQPQCALCQCEQYDGAESWSMFWYDPTVLGMEWQSPRPLFRQRCGHRCVAPR
ncbi:hypothetical protein C8J57DRAFT_1043612 [Mycena rebaudengoi]|nr:hypothetical protein C8J57DRAFT_1043612 [Mycena rebaudengoi]